MNLEAMVERIQEDEQMKRIPVLEEPQNSGTHTFPSSHTKSYAPVEQNPTPSATAWKFSEKLLSPAALSTHPHDLYHSCPRQKKW